MGGAYSDLTPQVKAARRWRGPIAEPPGYPLLFRAGPVTASPRRARGVSPLQPRRLGCTPLRSARVHAAPPAAMQRVTGSHSAKRKQVVLRSALRKGTRLGAFVVGGCKTDPARRHPDAKNCVSSTE